jgi:ergothioneine biosynthesis protein EgtB
MPDCSPPKWHLAHTTWFFETFLLTPHLPGYKPFHPQFSYLFNSYYETVGERWPRPSRGLLCRPTIPEVVAYRQFVDQHMGELLSSLNTTSRAAVEPILELGLQHEEQHQELLLTDLKHAFGQHPLRPVYSASASMASANAPDLQWQRFAAGNFAIGHAGPEFAFDNELPRHTVYLHDYQLANRVVTAGEYLAFVEDGGYQKPEYWLSEGWATCRKQGWQAPLYWTATPQGWSLFTLHGERLLDPQEPVCHISFFEADAYARWAGYRLPTEAEWEVAFPTAQPGQFLGENESRCLHPRPGHHAFGGLWQWTASPYVGYPGYRPAAGAVGEYNGKFMCNQMVLRGGSCLTPEGHIRPTYRNFFPPDARWQCTGLRLAGNA